MTGYDRPGSFRGRSGGGDPVGRHEAALKAVEHLETDHDQALERRRLAVEWARYEAERAQRRYHRPSSRSIDMSRTGWNGNGMSMLVAWHRLVFSTASEQNFVSPVAWLDDWVIGMADGDHILLRAIRATGPMDVMSRL